jgi:hypothetical protein
LGTGLVCVTIPYFRFIDDIRRLITCVGWRRRQRSY